MEKKVYPIGAEHYSLLEEVGQGVSASVHRAICLPFDEVVAIKILDFERDNCDLNNVTREAQLMTVIDHPNVLKSHCSFVCDHTLWVIMPFMSGGSCLHILKAAYPNGFEEVVIATILREVLKGLEYIHHLGHMHRDIKAGNVLIGARGSIRLGDYGVSACLFDSGDRHHLRHTFVGTPCWMAPEVMEQLNGYDFKADIWSFGITALELAHGHAPFSSYPPMKVLLMTLQNAPPGLDYDTDKKFSRSFKQMIASCLVKDPAKRPTAKRLLKHSFFKQARSNDYIARTLLEGRPNLGDRLTELQRKEKDMLAQKKMVDREKEELSQNEYKRGISAWNFNVEDVKAQVSSEGEESIADNNLGGSSSSLTGLDHEKHSQAHCSSTGSLPQLAEFDDNDLTRISPAHLPSTDSNLQTPKFKCENFDGEASTASPTPTHERQLSQNSSFSRIDHVMNGKISLGECSTTHPDRRGGGSIVNESTLSELNTLPISRERNKLHVHPATTSSCNGVAIPSSDADNSHLEVILGAPKSSVLSSLQLKNDNATANGDEIDDKTKTPLVQQRGRFKVTSESSVELEKVISQNPSISLPSPSFDKAPSSHAARSFYPMLHHVLQTNISQRETILRLQKNVSANDSTANHDAGWTPPPPNTSTTEKSPLEAAHDREKELIHEVTDLRWRLISVQDELQIIKNRICSGMIAIPPESKVE